MSADAVDRAAPTVRAGKVPRGSVPSPSRGWQLPSLPRPAEPIVSPDRDVPVPVTGITLTGPGPGRELVAHLDTVFEGLPESSGGPPGTALAGAEPERLLRLFDAQAGSRWLDVAARRMRAAGVGHHPIGSAGHHPIGSAGHEADAAVALAVTDRDPALLHPRSGAFYLARSAQRRRTGPLTSGVGRGLLDLALGLAGSATEPIAGGRQPDLGHPDLGHPDLGHPDLAVIPQPSTIAGHLPRAVGLAWALGRRHRLPERLRTPQSWPDDALVVASFGDASANHSTAAGAVNAACWTAHQGIPLPLLLVCEDSSPSAPARISAGWVAAQFCGRAGLVYRHDDGTDPLASLEIAAEAAALVREHRVPVLLHLRCVAPAEIAAGPAADPLAATVRAVADRGVLSAADVRARWASIRDEVAACVEEALREPRREPAEDVSPLAPHRSEAVAALAARPAPAAERRRAFGGVLPEAEGDLTLAQSINRTLLEEGARTPGLLVLGEDVGRQGGVHGVTRGLQRRLGASRVIDTVPDERTILGMALGAGVSGLLPVPQISSPALLQDAGDQLRGAATLQVLSQGAYRNPLVVRVPGLAHRTAFDGYVHDGLAIGALRDIPGLIVACPAHPSDAAGLLRTCLVAAQADGTVSVVLEPIALYHEQDLHEPGDRGWLAGYPAPDRWGDVHVPIGRARVWGGGQDVTVVSFGNGLRMSLRVARRLAMDGIGVRVVDLRWLAPLPVEDVLREASATGRCLLVEETRRSGGVSESLVTGLLEGGYRGLLARLGADDAGPADLVLVGEDDIEDAARHLLHPSAT